MRSGFALILYVVVVTNKEMYLILGLHDTMLASLFGATIHCASLLIAMVALRLGANSSIEIPTETATSKPIGNGSVFGIDRIRVPYR